MGRIFISHRNTPADNHWAEKIHRWIKDQKGIDGFLDFDIQDGLQAGQRWEDEIYAAMRSAQVVIAIVSNDWLASHWCTSEARMARLLGLKLILIITEECEVPFRDTQSIRLEKYGEDRAFEELQQALRTTHKLPERPYPGLAAFDEKDAAVFFGREDETRDLVNKVNSLFKGRPKTPRMLLVLGASGSGKSSLMRAGFLPEFKADPENLCIGPIIPGGDALDEIAEILDTPLDGLDAEAMADAIIASMKCANPSYMRAVICIDQAEELLDEENGSLFFEVLQSLLRKRRGRVVVLATMRSDFLNEFQKNRLIGPDAKLAYETMALDPLPDDHLGAIIRQPAELFGVKYEDELFAQICKDHKGPDALPLLAFFLDEFWRRDFIRDGVLQLSEYQEFGGVGQALEKAKDRAIMDCARLDAAYTDRQVLLDDIREVFLGLLVSVNASSGAAVRNRAPASAPTERQTALLTAFANQRLLIRKDDTWEVVHEALLRQWEDLKGWISEARVDLVAIARIEAAAVNWIETGRDKSVLIHSGDRLDTAVRMLESGRYAERFDESAKAYIDACLAKETERYEQEKQHLEEVEQQRDQAAAEARRAVRNQRLGLAALSSVELASRRPAEALFLGLAALPRRPDPTIDSSDYLVALRALENAGAYHREVLRIATHKESITCIAFSPDGTKIVSGGENNTLQIWDAQTGNPLGLPMCGHEEIEIYGTMRGHIHCVAFSPDGTKIVSAGEDQVFRLWDVKTGTQVGVPMDGDTTKLLGSIGCVAFSPDGTRIATAGYEQNFRLWDAKTGAQIGAPLALEWEMATELDTDYIEATSLAFSRDGTRIVIGNRDGTILRWNLVSGLPFEGQMRTSGKVVGAVFSGDGKRIVSVCDEGFSVIWDAQSGEKLNESMIGRSISDVAFSSDGSRIATAERDGTILLWDAQTGDPMGMPIYGHGSRDSAESSELKCLRFSPDDKQIVSGGVDTIRLWDVRTGMQIGAPMTGHENTVKCVAVSVDGREVISGDSYKKIRHWDAQSGRLLRESTMEHDGSFTEITISPDAARIAGGGSDGTVGLWDALTGSAIGNPKAVQDGAVHCVAFSPVGRWIVSWDDKNTFQLWDSQTGNPVGTSMRGNQEIEDPVHLHMFDCRVAVSPDGTRIVSGGTDGFLGLWNAQTGEQIGKLVGDNDKQILNAVAVSPDGDLIVSGSNDGTLRYWCARTGDAIGAPKIEHMGGVASLVFSHDQTRLASGGENGTIVLWDLATGCRITQMVGHTGRVCSVAFFPDGKRIVSGSSDGTVRLWDIDYGSGSLFEVLCRRLPTQNPPAILANYGIELDEPICSGEEPLPPLETWLSDDAVDL
jgi:WD40 repeat protein